MSTYRLKDFEIGDSARIVGFAPAHRSYRTKLLSMGLTKGTIIHIRNIAPLGDPVHLSVRDFDLSLRRDEAEALLLEPVVDGDGEAHGRHRRRGFGRFGRRRKHRRGRPGHDHTAGRPQHG